MKIVDKDLNMKIKVLTHGFEELTREDSRQRFESRNKVSTHEDRGQSLTNG